MSHKEFNKKWNERRKLGRAAPLTSTVGKGKRQRGPVCRQMPWQTKENNNRRNLSRQTIVLCSAYRNTWLPSVKGATYVTSIVLVFCFSNGHSVCHNCWAVRKSRHLLPLTTRGKIRDDLHRLGLELNWTCGQNRKQIIQTAFSQNHQIQASSDRFKIYYL